MDFRFTLVLLIFSVIYGGLGVHLYNLQIQKQATYSAKAASGNLAAALVRGNIYFSDKDGSPVPAAINKDYPTVFADPEKIAKESVDVKELAAKLDVLFDHLTEAELVSKLSKAADQYEEIAKNAPEEIVEEIKSLAVPGVYVKNEPRRFYPLGAMASHILGFVSADKEGKYGIESLFNEKLSGEDSPVGIGESVYLTIDPTVEAQAEKVLNNLVAEFKAKSGQVIVMDPKTGDVLAMAGTPSFDPNNYGKASIADFLNKPVQSVYEPGSVFKIVTISAAIDSGSITPETTYVDNGSVTINGRTIKNWDNKSHGRLTMTEVIEKSINTGTIFMAQKMGGPVFLDYIKKFGFNNETGVSLPGEVVGDIRELENKGAPVNFATASYGHGISVTPLRMLTAINAVANGGIMMKPRIIKNLPEEELGRPISTTTAETVKTIMIGAVDKARVAKINNFSVAGKTGTALVPKNGRYTEDVINTYVGFAPASNPRFSILLRMDEPEGAPLAGATIVPAFRELTEFLLVYYNVAPDRISQPEY